MQGAGGAIAVLRCLSDREKKEYIVEVLSTEGEKSAEIEGEVLERNSLQVSIQRHFGHSEGRRRLPLKEQGMGDLIWKLYDTYDQPLSHEMLFEWNYLLLQGERGVNEVGVYRSHSKPMQIVSSRYERQTVYFEAPPSERVEDEMSQFIEWFNDRRGEGSVLINAALVHLYFESIHPFEDGNGRIGRALVEKSLSHELGRPMLLALSQVLRRRRKEYYQALGTCNRSLDARHWIQFFSEVIVEAQRESLQQILFLIQKSKVMSRLHGQMNARQEKVLLRLFKEGPQGFAGGLSAENYISITKTSRATATRDLSQLVELGALTKTGQRKSTRYWLIL